MTITDTETGIKRVVKTNAIGEFEANGLKTGTYKVLIEASGFNGLELSGLPLLGPETCPLCEPITCR